MMRIIAGARRGHRIESPSDRSTRPTSDMVRESIFNIIGDRVEGRLVVDLFAGTGALGLEALSRGASRALFIENNRANLSLIRANATKLRYEDRARLRHLDAYRWMESGELPADEPVLVLIDPPYSEFENRGKRMKRGLGALLDRVAPGSLLVLEMPERIAPDILPPGNWDIRRYGSTRVGFLDVPIPDPCPPPTAGESVDAQTQEPNTGENHLETPT